MFYRHEPCIPEQNANILFILQRRHLRLREIKQLFQGYIAGVGAQEFKSVSVYSQVPTLELKPVLRAADCLERDVRAA